MHLIVPGLELAVVPCKVIEERVLLAHKHRDCSINCAVLWEWTPLIRILGDSVEVHLDSPFWLFATVVEAENVWSRMQQ